MPLDSKRPTVQLPINVLLYNQRREENRNLHHGLNMQITVRVVKVVSLQPKGQHEVMLQ